MRAAKGHLPQDGKTPSPHDTTSDQLPKSPRGLRHACARPVWALDVRGGGQDSTICAPGAPSGGTTPKSTWEHPEEQVTGTLCGPL